MQKNSILNPSMYHGPRDEECGVLPRPELGVVAKHHSVSESQAFKAQCLEYGALLVVGHDINHPCAIAPSISG